MARHLDLMSRMVAEEVTKGDGRLIFEVSPRMGKSELFSFWTPVWFLDRWPTKRVFLGSYGQDLAEWFGRRVRNAIDENPDELRVRVAQDSSAADDWSTTSGNPPGGMLSRGIGGGATGRGADLEIIDDPIKKPEEAFSASHRQMVWDWWEMVARRRLEPGATVIVTMARWHPDDFAGRLQAQGGWRVLRLPALAEENDPLGRAIDEPLWAKRQTREELIRERDGVDGKPGMTPRAWAAIMAQRPFDAAVGMFQRTWFEIVPQAPAGLRWVRFWDLASTEAKKRANPDWTAGALVAIKDDVIFIRDMKHARVGPGDVEKLVVQTAQIDGRKVVVRMPQDPGQAGKAQVRHYRKLLMGFSFGAKPESGDKTTRASLWAGHAQAGNVKLVAGAWNEPFLAEVEQFPAPGVKDDQVDATSGAFDYLTEFAPPDFW